MVVPEYPINNDLLDQIRELQQRVGILEKVNPLQNASVGGSVGGGQFRVFRSDGTLAAVFGLVGTTPELVFYASDGVSEVSRINPLETALWRFYSNTSAAYVATTFLIDNIGLTSETIHIGRDAAALVDIQPVFGGGGSVNIATDASGPVYIGHVTTALAANARIESTGQILRSTSSRKYKEDITDVEIDPAVVLQMRPRIFRDKTEWQEMGDDAPFYIGFVAEELDELGLHYFVEYDEFQEPDSIAYDRLAVALLAVVQEQNKRLETLEERLSKLEQAQQG